MVLFLLGGFLSAALVLRLLLARAARGGAARGGETIAARGAADCDRLHAHDGGRRGRAAARDELFQRIVHAAILSTGALSACIFEKSADNLMRGVAVEGLFPPHRPIPDIQKMKLGTRAKFIEQVLKSEVFPVGEGLVGRVGRDRSRRTHRAGRRRSAHREARGPGAGRAVRHRRAHPGPPAPDRRAVRLQFIRRHAVHRDRLFARRGAGRAGRPGGAQRRLPQPAGREAAPRSRPRAGERRAADAFAARDALRDGTRYRRALPGGAKSQRRPLRCFRTGPRPARPRGGRRLGQGHFRLAAHGDLPHDAAPDRTGARFPGSGVDDAQSFVGRRHARGACTSP